MGEGNLACSVRAARPPLGENLCAQQFGDRLRVATNRLDRYAQAPSSDHLATNLLESSLARYRPLRISSDAACPVELKELNLSRDLTHLGLFDVVLDKFG